MEIDQSEEENPRKPEALRSLVGKGALRTSIAKLSGSSRVIPSDTDFHFYNNFLEFKKHAKEIDEVSKSLLVKVGESEGLFRKTIPLPSDEKIELDDDLANDWIENVNDEIYEKFDVSLDEFKGLRKKEEKSGVRKMRVNLDDDSANGFQIVCGRKNKKLSGLDRTVEEWGMKRIQEVKVVEKLKPKVPFHIPTIPRPQDEYKIIVNNMNQPFEHVWLEMSDDGSTSLHPLEKLSVLDFVDKSDEIAEPVKPAPIELAPFKLIEELDQLKQLVVKLRNATEFAVDLEHNQYRSFQGLTCLMQISTRTEDFVIDTLKLRVYIGPHLRDVFKDPNKRKVMHGADRDILWLQRDFSIYVCNMFDTGQASRVLKMERNSLEFLLNHFCGVAANKEYQNADWRLRPLPNEMIRYAREDTHYLLYIYDVLRTELLKSSAESESSDSPLIEVYKRSYNICSQLYEKELLTSNSYLYIYGLQDAELNAEQLAVVSGLCEWRDIVARVEDESTGYVLPNRTLIELAKQMPLTPRKLRSVLKAKHPYIERNLGPIVSIIKQSIQNANAFEKAAEYLKERRLELTNEENALATEESECSPPEEPEVIKNAEQIENTQYGNLLSDHTSIASVECKNELISIGSPNVGILANVVESAHCYHKKKGNEKGGSDGCAADVQGETLLEPGHSIHTEVNLLQRVETTVQVQKKPSRAFGALFGNSAKRTYDPVKKEQECHKLEHIKSTVTLPFHTFSGKDELILQSDVESTKMSEVSHRLEDDSAPATGSTLEDVIVFGDDSDVEESAKGNSDSASDGQLKQEENNKAGSVSETEGDEPMSLADLSSSFQKCFPSSLQQTKSSKQVKDKSKPSQDILQVEPFDYAAARNQVKFGESRRTQTPEESDDHKRSKSRRDRKKGSGILLPSQKAEENTDLPQGRRRLAFPASGNRSATFR